MHLIVISPGVPGDQEILDNARKKVYPSLVSLSLILVTKVPIIAVMEQMENHYNYFDRRNFKNDGKNITLAGNIRIPLIEVENAEKRIIYSRVSSFQLETSCILSQK